ncbi:MAG: diguanylate cyclase [Deltaproteobacteria bacterium]|nr:diguanylate cyclase [Deltaproteobacteria bacterium]
MPSSVAPSRSIARKIAFAAGGASIVGAVTDLVVYSVLLRTTPSKAGPIAVALACLLALGVGLVVVKVVLSRLGVPLRRLVDAMSKAEEGDFLTRVPVASDDEVGALSTAFNRMLAAITNLRVSVIDQERELEIASERLGLQEALQAKSGELERRLQERRLLFDVLATSTSSLSLDDVLTAIARSCGEALGLREFGILLREEAVDGPPGLARHHPEFVVRAAYGFKQPSQVLGLRRHAGEGVSGEVARTGQAIVIDDVQNDDRYLSYGGLVERVGSFVCVPVRFRDEVIALLDFTRSEVRAFSAPEVALFGAIGEVAAHAIGNARLFERVQALSLTDELTGLGNRRQLEERLEAEFERANRFQQPLSLLFIDLDHFKLLNDRAGHPVGDSVLRGVARVIRQAVRKLDTVARFGGEEIVVILPRADKSEAIAVANKVRERVFAEMMPHPESGAQPGGAITVSIGVATYPSDAADARTLVSRADEAVYAAKRAGRNCVVGYGVAAPRTRASA